MVMVCKKNGIVLFKIIGKEGRGAEIEIRNILVTGDFEKNSPPFYTSRSRQCIILLYYLCRIDTCVGRQIKRNT